MADREIRDERRMTDLEALMWNLDKDPHLTSSFANVTLLDRLPDHDRLRARLLAASRRATRLRQRVVPALGRLAPPTWEPDPNFDIDYHLQATALAGPASLRQLLDFAARIHQAPFERTRPLWQFVIVGGPEGGRAALIQKMHHTITDGVGGLRLAEAFIDLERDPDGHDAGGPTPPAEEGPPAESRGPAADANMAVRMVDTATHLLGRTASGAAGAALAAAGAVRHPSRLLDAGSDAVGTVSSVTRELRGGSGSPLWHPRTLQRRIETLRVPLARAKATARAHDVTVNDVFVTGAARGAGRYHDAGGEPVKELRMAMPVSTRTDATASGNAFALTRCSVPVAGVDPVEHLRDVHARLAGVRAEPAFRVLEQLSAAANALPTSALVAAARRQAEMVDFTTSNLRGAPFPLYLAGALIEANYPVGPMAGTAFNLTCLSANGMLDMGLHVDSGAVERPGALHQAIEEAYAEILST